MGAKLATKTVLVTGAAGGIGAEITAQAVAAGYRVLAADISEAALKSLAAQFPGGEVVTAKLDVTSAADWQACLEVAQQEWGGLSALVNNAGVLFPKFILDMSADQITATNAINANGLMLGSNIVGKAMREQGFGHIVNVASMGGLVPTPGIAVYSASKFAARAFSIAAAAEFKEFGIKVCTVCPDAVQTPMLDIQKGKKEGALTFSGSRALTAAEVAQAVVQRGLSDEPPIELILPSSRGYIAKLANLNPAFYNRAYKYFMKIGLKNQAKQK